MLSVKIALSAWIVGHGLAASMIGAPPQTPASQQDRLLKAIVGGDARSVASMVRHSPSMLDEEVEDFGGARLETPFKLLWIASGPAGSAAAFRAILRTAVLSKDQLQHAWSGACSALMPTLVGARTKPQYSRRAIERRQLLKLKSLCALYPTSFASADPEGTPEATLALFQAARFDWPRVLRFLVHLGMDVGHTRDVRGDSALHWAGSPRMVHLLARLGLSPNVRNKIGRTPLHISGNLALIKALLDAGARWDVADNEGLTPLIYAIRYDLLEESANMIRAGANPSLVSSRTRTSAADEMGGNLRVLKWMVSRLPKRMLRRVFSAVDGKGLAPAESWVSQYAHPKLTLFGYEPQKGGSVWRTLRRQLELLKRADLPLHPAGRKGQDLVHILSAADRTAEATELMRAGVR